MSAAGILTGQCVCGAVRYEVADGFEYALNCYCSDCRRATGSAFKPFAGIAAQNFAVTQGADALLIFGDASGHDARCRVCGSLLYSLVRDGAYVHVTLGTLTGDPAIRPAAHIFTGSKAPWYSIADGLPQYQTHIADAGE